ncbi:hypothetical protein [Streptomyces ortus]|uniref:Molecular chaperone DnaJ n=1 Tax=Streptomyces ortus TaxID=2867268 RepID=A0ABT3V696_9ACTN|nr:hypothetical protein [Streptomyces ortus]MCX4235514.1 hypothetical protein [Streptomyces ortus]
MAQLAPARARICRACDGFAAAVITTGTRHRDGTRVTLRVTCPACQGTGHTTPARRRETARV